MPPPAAPDALQRQRLLNEKPCVMRDDDADAREVSLHPPKTPVFPSPSPRGRETGRMGEGGKNVWAGGWKVRMNAMRGASGMHIRGVSCMDQMHHQMRRACMRDASVMHQLHVSSSSYDSMYPPPWDASVMHQLHVSSSSYDSMYPPPWDASVMHQLRGAWIKELSAA